MAMLDNTSVKISDVSITSNAPYFANQAVSGKYQKRYTGIQFFTLEFTANYQMNDMGTVKQFVAQHQYGQPFEFPLSWFSEYNGTAQGTITVAASASAGARLVNLSNFTGTLEAGSVIKFANQTKLYTVMADVEPNGQVSLFPSLRASVQANEIINYRSAKGTFVLTNDKIEWPINSLNKLKLTATEQI